MVDHRKKLEDKLGITVTYRFTVNRVRAFLDTDDIEPVYQDTDIVLFKETCLDQLAKQVKGWIKRKEAGYIEGDEDSGTFYMIFDTTDLTVNATVHALDQDNQDVPLSPEEFQKFLERIDRKRHAKKQG